VKMTGLKRLSIYGKIPGTGCVIKKTRYVDGRSWKDGRPSPDRADKEERKHVNG
jgi:hypothetical protein